MSRILSQAKTSLNFMQRNKLNSAWQQKRELFKKIAQMHKQQANKRTVEKFKILPDLDNPDGSIDFLEHEASLFAVDLSHIDGSRSYSEVGGGLLSKTLQQSSFMDFEVAPEVSNTVENNVRM